MALTELVEPSADAQQKDAYNRSGPTGARKVYTPSADTAWCILGLILGDVVVPGDEDALVTAIEALSEVDNVANPRFWGQAPSSVLATGHEFLVSVVSRLSCQIGYGADVRSHARQDMESVRPPVDKKFMVVNCVVPAALDQTSIATLESAVAGITGITTCEHLADGVVPTNATEISLGVEVKMRIDPEVIVP